MNRGKIKLNPDVIKQNITGRTTTIKITSLLPEHALS